jgi:hypothetical protein
LPHALPGMPQSTGLTAIDSNVYAAGKVII